MGRLTTLNVAGGFRFARRVFVLFPIVAVGSFLVAALVALLVLPSLGLAKWAGWQTYVFLAIFVLGVTAGLWVLFMALRTTER